MIRKIKSIIEARKLKGVSNKSVGKIIKKPIKKGKTFTSIYSTKSAEKLHSENPKLANAISKISSQLGKLNGKLPSKLIIGNLKLTLISKNKIMALGAKSTSIKYSLEVNGRRYLINLESNMVTGFRNYIKSITQDNALKETLKANNINVVEPIYRKGIAFVENSKKSNPNRVIEVYDVFFKYKNVDRTNFSDHKLKSIQNGLNRINNNLIKKKILSTNAKIELKHLLFSPITKKYYIQF
jgi:hypothetical protein